MIEIWKDIVGYEGLYQVSDLGRLKSLERKIINPKGGGYRLQKEMILRVKNSRDGYLFYSLCKNGKPKRLSAHRLVAETFIPNPENKPEVNHKQGIRGDNRASQLEWVTKQENIDHAYNGEPLKTYLNSLKGAGNKNAKLNEKQVKEIKFKYRDENISFRGLAKEYGMHPSTIFEIVKGTRWPHITI